jgi:hypothetical protein
MADRGEDNFGNEGARAYLGLLTTQLVATIKAIAADPERLEPDEDGESMLMPSVEILAQLCERCGATPPRPDAVRQWARKYLEAFDAAADPGGAAPGRRAGRRKVIENTFRWLESLADSYWDR